MKKLFLTFLPLIFIIVAQAQFGVRPFALAPAPPNPVYAPLYQNVFFKIHMLNDSIIYAKGSIKVNDRASVLVFKNDGKRVRMNPSETVSIAFLSEVAKDTITGFPFENNWYTAANALSDSIIVYKKMLDEHSFGMHYLFKRGNSFVWITRELVQEAVKGDSEAEKQATRANFIKAVWMFNDGVKRKNKVPDNKVE